QRPGVRASASPELPRDRALATLIDRSALYRVSSNPTGEVRPRFHKLATKQARRGLAIPEERCDDPSAAFGAFARCLVLPTGAFLAMEPALSGKCRLKV